MHNISIIMTCIIIDKICGHTNPHLDYNQVTNTPWGGDEIMYALHSVTNVCSESI